MPRRPLAARRHPDRHLLGYHRAADARDGSVEDVLELDATRDQELVRPTAWAGENRYLYLARRKDGEPVRRGFWQVATVFASA